MRNIKSLLRLYFEVGLTRREIATSLDIGYGTVANYLTRAKTAGLTWPLPPEIGERELARLLFPTVSKKGKHARFTQPDFAVVHSELKSPGMTKLLAWEEYRQQHPDDGYSYSQFCHRYAVWLQQQKTSMRQIHIAGEKCFIDFCGPTVDIICAATGEVTTAQIFVAVLGASNYTFACATRSQKEADWIDAHTRAATFFGGWTKLTVPDNLKSGVTKTDRYVPTINASYAQWADYYGTAILPARPYKPKDKAKAETAVLIVERWILARLRHHTFFTLEELNTAIADLLIDLNERPFKKLPGCRRSQFESLDKPALLPLPTQPYEYQHVKKARVHIDYHIEYDRHYYSVPHALVKSEVEVRATTRLVTLYAHGKPVATHRRSTHRGAHTTQTEHMPVSHRQFAQWSPERFLEWAEDIGPATAKLVAQQLQKRRHPEQAYRSVLALLSLAKRYGRQRLEAACRHAISIGSPTRTSVQSILKHGIDKIEQQPPAQKDLLEEEYLTGHDNVRGSTYYH